MRHHLVITLLSLSSLFACAEDELPPSPIGRQVAGGAQAVVLTVSDGDTLQVQLAEGEEPPSFYIRVLGIDCPETRRNDKCARDEAEGRRSCDEQIPLGQRAKVRARALLQGATVSLEPGEGGFEWDVYDRLLAYIRLSDGRDLGLTLIDEGLCSDFSWRYPHPRSEAYRAADRLGP